jgi:hypothetical protein
LSQNTYIVVKYKIHLYSLRNRHEKLANGSLFCLFLKLVQINFIFTDNVRILYIYHFKLELTHPSILLEYLTTMYVFCVYPAMSKKSENFSDLDKKDRNKRHSSPIINVVKGVFFVVRVTLVPVSYLSAPSAVHSYRLYLTS